MNNPFEFSVYIAGLAAITLVVDYMMRGKFRQDFAVGVAVIAGAMIALVSFGSVHHAHYTKADRFIGLGLLIMIMLGSILFDNANIRAQQRGEMSKWGDAIELFQNNYWSNVRDKYKTWVGVAILSFVMVGTLFEKEVQPEQGAAVLTASEHHAAVSVKTKTSQSNNHKTHPAKSGQHSRKVSHHKDN